MKKHIFEIQGHIPGENALVCMPAGVAEATANLTWLLKNCPEVTKVVGYRFKSGAESIRDIEDALAARLSKRNGPLSSKLGPSSQADRDEESR